MNKNVQKSTNSFLVMGIILAFVLIILGVLIYAYISSTQTEAVIQQTNQAERDANDDNLNTDTKVNTPPLSYLL